MEKSGDEEQVTNKQIDYPAENIMDEDSTNLPVIPPVINTTDLTEGNVEETMPVDVSDDSDVMMPDDVEENYSLDNDSRVEFETEIHQENSGVQEFIDTEHFEHTFHPDPNDLNQEN